MNSTASLASSCGTSAAWPATRRVSKEAISEIRALRERFWKEVRVPGNGEDINQSLERAGRVADFLEFGELMCLDALTREESCGGHFRTEHQTADGEALRHDDKYASVFAWMFKGVENDPELVREELEVRGRPPRHPQLQVTLIRPRS